MQHPHLLSTRLHQWPALDQRVRELRQNRTATAHSAIPEVSACTRLMTYLAALSKKFRKYFFCSTSGFTVSATSSIALTSGSTYADWPLTCFTVAHGVRESVVSAESHAESSSRSMTMIAAEIALVRHGSERRDAGRVVHRRT